MLRLPFFGKNGGQPPRRKPGNLLAVGRDNQLFTEKIKGLRAVVEQKSDLHRLKVIGITSAVSGEGKTLTCAQLAGSLASTGRKKVLLVDADIRKADLTHGLGGRRSPGLTDFLQGGATLEQVLRPTQVPNLHLVTTGAEVTSPADLLAGDRFKMFLKEVRDRYDMVLLDTPPVLPVADTQTIRSHTDGFIVLYKSGSTPHKLFRQAMDDLEEKNVIGVVLNGVDSPSDSYYRKYYGSYYTQSVTAAVEDKGSDRPAMKG